MRRGIDFERHRVALFAPGRARLVFGAVGHLDVDHVILGMRVGLHVMLLGRTGYRPARERWESRKSGSGPLARDRRRCKPRR